ncbi:hemagglutinin repeat-containing protein [Sagittula sp. S175]|uniref:hemagglutinin repeat-containing protein n=1 Tax=Sagittula sp. S175 TaxID=3415129 RepID=UPI003C797DB0
MYNRTSDIVAGGDVSINSGLDRVQFWDNASLTTGGALTITAGESGDYADGIHITGVPLTAAEMTLTTTGRVVLYPGSDLKTTSGDLIVNAGRRLYQYDSDFTSAKQLLVSADGVTFTGSHSQSVNYMKYDSQGSVEIYDGYSRNPLLKSTAGSVDVYSRNSHIDTRKATIDGYRYVMLNARNNMAIQTTTTVRARTLNATLKAGVGGHIYYRYGSNVSAGQDVILDSRNHVYLHGRTLTAGRDIIANLRGQFELYNDGAARAKLQAGRNITVNAEQGRILTRTSDWVATAGDIAIDAGTHSVEFWDGATVTTAGAFSALSGNWDGRGVRLIGMPVTATSITLGSGTGHILLDPGSHLTSTVGAITVAGNGRYYQRNSNVIAKTGVSITSNGVDFMGSALTAQGGAITMASGGSIDINDAYSRNPSIWASGAITLSSANAHIVNNGTINGGGNVSLTSKSNLHNDTSAIIKSRTGNVTVRSISGHVYNRYASTIEAKQSATVRAGVHLYNHGATAKAINGNLTLIAGGAIENHQWSTTRGLLSAGGNLSATAGTTHFWTHSSDMVAGGNMTVGSTGSHLLAQNGATFTQGGSFTGFSGSYDGYGLRLFGVPITATSIALSSSTGYVQLEPAALTATAGDITINSAGRFYQRDSAMTASGGIAITANGYENDGSWTTAQGGAISVTSRGSVDITDAYSRNPRLWASGGITISSSDSHFVNNGEINGGGDVRITSRNNLHNDSSALIRSRAGNVHVTSNYGNIYNRYASSLHARKSVVANAVRGGIYNHGGTIHGIDTDATLTAAYAIENHQWSATRGLIKAGRNVSAQAGLSHLWSVSSDWVAGNNMRVGSTGRQVEVTTGSTFTQGGSFTAFSGNWEGRGVRLYGAPITATSIALSSTSGYVLLEPANLTATAGDITINAAGRYYQRNTDLVASGGISITSNGADIMGSGLTANGGAITIASASNVAINDAYSRNPWLWASGAITVSSSAAHVVNNGNINGGGDVRITSKTNLHNETSALIRSRAGQVVLTATNGSVHNRYSAKVESKGNTTFNGINIYNDGSTVAAGGKIEMTASNYLQVIEHGSVRSVLTSGAGQALNLRAGTANLLVRNTDATSGGTLYIGSAQSSVHNHNAVLTAASSALLKSKGEFRATGGSLVANGVTIDSDHHLYLLGGHRLTARNGAYDVTMTAFYDYLERDSFVTAGRNVTLTDARNVYFYDSDTTAKTGSVSATARGELKHRIEDTDESRTTAGLDVSMFAAGYLENYRASITAGRSAVLRSTGGTLSNNSASVTSGADMTLQAAHDLYLSRGLATRDTRLTAAGSLTVTAGNTLYADAGLVDAGGWLKFNSRLTPRFGAQVYDNAKYLHLGVNVSQGSFTSYFGADTTGAIDIYARDGVTLTKGMRGDNWVRVRSGGGAISAGYLLRSDGNWLQVTGGGNITLGNAQAAGNVTIESTAGSVINTYNISSSQALSVKAHKDIIAQASVATRRGAFRGAGSVNMNAGRSMTITNALVSSNGQIDMYAGQKELGTLSVTTTLADLKSGVENRVTNGAAINMIVNYGGHISLTGAEIYGLGRVNTFAGAGGGGQYTTRAATIGTAKVGTLLRGQEVIQNATGLTLADTEVVGLGSVAQYAQLSGNITMDRGRIQTHNLRIEALGNTNAQANYRDLTDIVVGGTLTIDVASAANLKAGTINAGTYDLTNTPNVTLTGNVRQYTHNNLYITAKNNLTLGGSTHRRDVALTSLNGVLANTGTLRSNMDITFVANRTVSGVTLRNDGLLWATGNVYLTADRGIDPGRVQAANLTVRSQNGNIGATGAMMATGTIDLFANDITTRSVLAQNVVIDARRGSFTVKGWQTTDGTAFQTGLGEFVSRMGDIVGTVSEVVDGETQEVTQAQFEADLLASGNAMFHVESDLTIETRDNINVLPGGILSARGNMSLTAGKGVLVQSAFGESTPDIVVTSLGGIFNITTQVKKFWHRRASIVADGDLTITALGNGLDLTDAGTAAVVAARDAAWDSDAGFTHTAGNGVIYNQGTISAGGNLILNAARDIVNKSTRVTYTLTAEHNCGYNACGSDAYMFAPGEIIAGQGLIMTAGMDILNDASQVAAAGSIYATVGNDIYNNIQTAHFLSYYYKKTKRGWFGIKTGETIDKRYSAAMQSGVFQTSFGNIDLIAGRDIDSSGSYVSSGANARLVAGRDVYMDAVSVELDNYYKNSGFSGFLTYSSTKTRYNNFETSMAQVEGYDVSIEAGRNVTGIGVILLAMNDMSIVAGQDMVYDALTNRKYLEESGWSFGLTSSRFTITQSVLNNANNDPIHQYIADNPMLGAAYQLATAKDGWGRLNGSLALLVSGARTLSTARDEEVGTNLFGSKLAESFIPNDIKAIQAIGNCGGNDVTRCVMEAAGIGFRFDAWHSRSEWDESLVSRLGAGRDMFLMADRDIQLAGGTIVNTGRDLVISAGRDFMATALANTQENSSHSFGFGVSLFAGGFTVSVDGSGSNANSKLYTNASINAMNSITLVTGRDAMLLGAVMQARPVTGIREDANGNPILDERGNYIEILGDTGGDIYMDIGRDLVVASRQSTSASNSWGFGLSLTFTGGTLSGVGINANIADGNARYVATPSMIDAYRILDIYVDEKTYLMGAVIASRNGGLHLDTGYLIHDNLFNSHNSYSVNVGLNIGVGQTLSFDGTGGFTLDVTEGFTRATISGGDVVVRNQRNFDMSQINQNLNKVDTITRDTHVNLQLPALNLVKLAHDLEAAGNYIRAATADVPDEVRARGDVAVTVYRRMVASGMPIQEAIARTQLPEFQASVNAIRRVIELEKRYPEGGVPEDELFLMAIAEQALYDADGNIVLRVECDLLGRCEIAAENLEELIETWRHYVLTGETIYLPITVRQQLSDNFTAFLIACSQENPDLIVQFVQTYGAETVAHLAEFRASSQGNVPWAQGFDSALLLTAIAAYVETGDQVQLVNQMVVAQDAFLEEHGHTLAERQAAMSAFFGFAVGFLPVVGDAMDAADLLEALENRDIAGVFISGIGFIPLGGDAFQALTDLASAAVTGLRRVGVDEVLAAARRDRLPDNYTRQSDEVVIGPQGGRYNAVGDPVLGEQVFRDSGGRYWIFRDGVKVRASNPADRPNLANNLQQNPLQAHGAHHQAYVDDLSAQLEDMGYEVANDVRFHASCNAEYCLPDIVYRDPSTGRIVGIIEVKTGNATLSTNQTLIYPQIRDGSSIPSGDVARSLGLEAGVPLRDQGYPNGINVYEQSFPGLGN